MASFSVCGWPRLASLPLSQAVNVSQNPFIWLAMVSTWGLRPFG